MASTGGSIVETGKTESIKRPLPQEIVDMILKEFLRAAEPVDYYAKPWTYYRALAPFNINRTTRMQAASTMARYLRFIGTLRLNNALTSGLLYDFAIVPEPVRLLRYLRHLELRISLGSLTQTTIGVAQVLFTLAQILDASLRPRDVQWFVKCVVGTNTTPQLTTVTYTLDCFTHPTELSNWWVLPKCAAIVSVVDQIQLASPAHAAAFIKLDFGGRSPTREQLKPFRKHRIRSLAGKMIMSPGIESDIKPIVIDLLD